MGRKVETRSVFPVVAIGAVVFLTTAAIVVAAVLMTLPTNSTPPSAPITPLTPGHGNATTTLVVTFSGDVPQFNEQWRAAYCQSLVSANALLTPPCKVLRVTPGYNHSGGGRKLLQATATAAVDATTSFINASVAAIQSAFNVASFSLSASRVISSGVALSEVSFAQTDCPGADQLSVDRGKFYMLCNGVSLVERGLDQNTRTLVQADVPYDIAFGTSVVQNGVLFYAKRNVNTSLYSIISRTLATQAETIRASGFALPVIACVDSEGAIYVITAHDGPYYNILTKVPLQGAQVQYDLSALGPEPVVVSVYADLTGGVIVSSGNVIFNATSTTVIRDITPSFAWSIKRLSDSPREPYYIQAAVPSVCWPGDPYCSLSAPDVPYLVWMYPNGTVGGNQTYATPEFGAAAATSGGMAVDAGTLYLVDTLVDAGTSVHTSVVRSVMV
jgi:hypothetical protein